MTLERSLELARGKDIDAAAWRAKIDSAKADLTSARTLPNPTTSITWEDVGLKDAATGKSLASHTYGISYPIFFWWPRDRKIAVAKANQRAEEAAVRGEKRQLSTEIGSSYFELVADQRKVALSEDLLKTADGSVRFARKEKELGEYSDYEVRRAEAERLQTAGELEDARNQLRQDQLAFAFALGADRPAFPAVEDIASTQTLAQPDLLTTGTVPESIIEQALKGNPEWARTSALREAAEAQLQLEKRSALPLTDASASTGRKSAPEGRSRQYAIEVPIPLLDWNQGAIRKAGAELLSAQSEEEKARREAVESIATTWEKCRAARLKYFQYAEPLSKDARANEKAALRLFSEGQTNYADLLQTQRDAKQLLLGQVDTWRDTVKADWELACLLGKQDQ